MNKIFIILLATGIWAVEAAAEGDLAPNSKRLAGVWIGLGDDGAPFHRLQLDSDGTGFLALGEPRMPVSVLRINQWSLNGTNVAFVVSVLVPREESTNSASISMSGSWYGLWETEIISLERRAAGHISRARLRKESDFDSLAGATKRATDAARSDSASKP
jgi:hypothetical protein